MYLSTFRVTNIANHGLIETKSEEMQTVLAFEVASCLAEVQVTDCQLVQEMDITVYLLLFG